MAKLRPNDKARPSTEDISRLAELKRQKDPLESDDLNREWALKAWPDIERRAFFYSKLNPLAAREDNWFAAERDILKGITSEELKDVEGQIRGMIQHENDLLNHRIQWFLIINGFLLTATASLKTKPTNETLPMLAILALVGFLVCISFWFSLGIGRRGVGRLADMWEHYRDLYYRHEPPSGCHQIGVLGWRSTKWASRAAPWFALPILFSSVWILLFYVHLVSMSTLNTPKNNPQIQIEKQNARPQKPSVHKDQNSTNNVLVPENQESRKPASIELSTTANKQATAETALRKDILSNIAGLELSLNPSSLQVMDKVVRELDWGNIVFTTPRTMQTEEPVIIELALSATKSAQDLQSSLHKNHFNLLEGR